ncbi:MAG TPA: RNA polymerase sigma factor [Planctomycetota bacterium]|nr:RNA polymerase sigma factor [Planctomycetota bacterium]
MSRSSPPRSSPERDDPSGALLARWQENGDREALDELIAIEISRLKARVRTRANSLRDPLTSASDVAQEAVLRMLDQETPPRFDHPRALRAYLWTTAWRLLADRLRSSGRTVMQFDPTKSGALGNEMTTTGGLGGVEAQDMSVALEVTVNLLDPAEQEILNLVHFQARGIEGAARELDLSRDAANMRWVRARRSLAKKLLHWSELIG